MFKSNYLCSISDVKLTYLKISCEPLVVLVLTIVHKERNNVIESKIDVIINKYFKYNEIDESLLMKLKVFFIGKNVEVFRVGKGKQHWEIPDAELHKLYNEFCEERSVFNE